MSVDVRTPAGALTQIAGLQVYGPDELPDDYGRFLIHGIQGSGKSTLASTIAESGPTLFIDLRGEKGVRSFKGAPYGRNIDVIRPESITALDDVFWTLAEGDHQYRAVVIDSLTAAQKMAMRFMLGHDETAVREIRRGGTPADQRTWGQTLDIMVDLATFWFGLADGNRDHPMHVVMTAQTKVLENEDTGLIWRVPDVQKGALPITLATADYILYTDLVDNPDGEISEDGSPPPQQHIVRFGNDVSYRIKARIPFHLRGRLPSTLGRKTAPSLTTLSRVLGVGGISTAGTKKKDAEDGK